MNGYEEAHILVEDMADFINGSNVDDNYFRLAAKVNAHIMSCEHCREDYNALLSFGEAIEAAGNYIPSDKDFRINLIKGLYFFENEHSEKEKKISEYIGIIKKLTYSVKLKIGEFGSIACEGMGGTNRFYHPAFATSLKAFSENDASAQTGVIKSTIVDDESNRITIGIDGTLSLYLNKYECYPGTLVILIPEVSSGKPYFSYAVRDSQNENMVNVYFDNVSPGNYTVALKE